MTNVQWFPGHMAKTKRMIQDQIKLVDVVIELVDARLPMSSRNPLLDKLVEGKPRVVILNKEDLADPQRTAYWIKYFSEQEKCKAFAFNATVGKKQLIAKLKEALMEVTAEKRERMAKKGIRKQTIRCMIVGIPNVGKSTFINILVGKKVAQTGDKAGVTRGKQWIRLDDDLELLDTPGILWPKFEDPEVGFRLAATGAINDDIVDEDDIAFKLLGFLKERYPKQLMERFKLDEEILQGETLAIMDQIGKNRGCLLKGGRVDYSKVSKGVILDLRQGKIGRITLE
ncbi:MAG: ribosome biogenesis GTPase YlqF [Peptococcaceae bacterium]|nr:ribosome biogenesis GTPase YlqF [Peptococcaceae bacterium]